ncbi:MAG: DNA helicase-2/ATP-dependent DNA helicase PcrA [Planctomycetota bacterium]
MTSKGLLEGLNPEQRLAVETTEGPVLVLAGAGTGKTRVITTRIAHLMAKGVPATSVLAMTFTNKAAGEMRERVAGLVGKRPAEDLTVGTFHSFCVGVLRRHGMAIGIPKRFTICDSSDQVTALRSALRDLRVPSTTIQPAVLQSKISLLKNCMVTPEKALEGAKDDEDELVGRAYDRYQAHLSRARTLDFDDLLLKVIELFDKDPQVLESLRERYRYVLVDEYQDTNAPQYEIVKRIASKHRNLCVVGDDDQSIYGWRGADVSKILGFEKQFPGSLVVRLETNYRSTEQILETANKLIKNNPTRHEKTLRSAFGPGERIKLYTLEDEHAESEFVVRDIVDLVSHRKAHFGEFAILIRAAVQARAFEEQLRLRNVPYILVGGMSFFDRKEVRDVLAYMRLLENPDDEVSFLRIVNCPPRGIGKTSIDRALAFATEQGISVLEAFDRAAEIPKLSPTAVDAVRQMRTALASLGKEDPGPRLAKHIEELLEIVGYRSEVNRVYADAQVASDRWKTVEGIVEMAAGHVKRSKKPSLSRFLERLTLSANDDRSKEDSEEREVVTIMTLHAAKGLEFPRVYLVGVEERLLPHSRAALEDTIEEERRLAYVGITRARRVLTITLVQKRARYGTIVDCHASRFLYEIRGEEPPEGWIPAGAKVEDMLPAGRPGKTVKKVKKKAKRTASKAKAKKVRSATGTAAGTGSKATAKRGKTAR